MLSLQACNTALLNMISALPNVCDDLSHNLNIKKIERSTLYLLFRCFPHVEAEFVG